MLEKQIQSIIEKLGQIEERLAKLEMREHPKLAELQVLLAEKGRLTVSEVMYSLKVSKPTAIDLMRQAGGEEGFIKGSGQRESVLIQFSAIPEHELIAELIKRDLIGGDIVRIGDLLSKYTENVNECMWNRVWEALQCRMPRVSGKRQAFFIKHGSPTTPLLDKHLCRR
ncbi:MAG: hypothetical protein HZB67_00930 [Candidatus Aenigmarchaeota archaeon]|nr:hypothetical protein [Candidatus Aenigmarchaeota archaeon]